MEIEIPIVGGQFESGDSAVNDQLCKNLAPEMQSSGAKAPAVLRGTPGLKPLFTAPAAPCRGNGVVFGGKGYFAAGNKLIEIDQYFNVTVIGTLNTLSGRVSLGAGFSYMAGVDGQYGYAYGGSATWTFSQITDPDYPAKAAFVEWVDKYFIFPRGDGTFIISALENPADIDPTDFATAEKRADNLLRPIWFRGDLALIGESTTELYYNSGNADFPWDPMPNTVFEFGTPAPHSAAVGMSCLYMLTKSMDGGYMVMRISSEAPTRVSNVDLETQLGKFSYVGDAFGFVYTHGGHEFYQLTFPSADRTYCYDHATGVWHERGSGDGRHRAAGHLFFNGKHIIGDYETGQFYVFDDDTYTDGGITIKRVRRSPAVHMNGQPIFFNSLWVDFVPGVGLVSGQGEDPKAMLRFSDDGGRTWSGTLEAPIGKIGEYRARAAWKPLGMSYNRIFEISVTDPVKVVIQRAVADIEVGDR